jgi:hypothetical protein
MIQRGRVLRDTQSGPGLLSVNGKQHTFTLEQNWRSEMPPRSGMVVELSFDSEGLLDGVQTVPESILAREQAAASLSEAQHASRKLASRLVARFGWPTLLSELLLVLGWFLFPFLSIHTGFFNHSATLWQALSYLSAGNPLADLSGNIRGSGSGSGLYELLCVIALAGPLLPYLWKDRRAVFGNLFPLIFMVGLIAVAVLSVHDAMPAGSDRFSREIASTALDSLLQTLSVGLGAYLSVATSVYLAFVGARRYLVHRAETQPG